MLTEAQLKERATYIGSSDAKVIASGDIEEWQTLAAQKRGEETWRPSKQVQLMMDAGSHMESFILKKWEEQSRISRPFSKLHLGILLWITLGLEVEE